MSSLQFILHVPWFIAALILMAGAGLFITANRRQDKTLERVGIIVVIVAVVLGTLGFLLQTDAQKIEKRSKAIVKAVSDKDWNKLKTLLSAKTVVGTTSIAIVEGSDEIVKEVQDRVERYGVKWVTSSSTETKQDDTLITVSMDIISDQEATQDRPIPSSWQFDYQQFGDDWVLQKITLIRIGTQGNDPMINPFGR